MTDELRSILVNSERYKNFNILDKPVSLKEFAKDRDYPYIQVHSAQIFKYDDIIKDIVGFCGVCKFENNRVEPLDGDSYSDDMEILAYADFECEDGEKGLDILVEDW